MDAARRTVIGALAAVCLLPAFARAAPERRVWRIAIPVDSIPEASRFLRDVVAELSAQGLAEGRDFELVPIPIPAGAEGINLASWERHTGEIVKVRPDLILTSGTELVRSLARLAPQTPIVFFMIGDPVRSRLVASMARPGANVTGVSNRILDLIGKRLELLRELSPNVRRVAMLVHGAIDGPITRREFFEAARKLGIEGVELKVQPGSGVAGLAGVCRGAKADAVFDGRAVVDPGFPETAEAMRRCGIPAIYTRLEIVEAGGLLSLGARLEDQVKSASAIVAKIVRGANPATIPVDQLSRIHLAVNLKTASELKLVVPQSILLRADEVIGGK